jgi:hypothetical protein
MKAKALIDQRAAKNFGRPDIQQKSSLARADRLGDDCRALRFCAGDASDQATYQPDGAAVAQLHIR